MKRYKIAFLSSVDPHDKTRLSGSLYYMLLSLQKYVGDVDVLGPVFLKPSWLGYVAKAGKLLKYTYNINHSFVYAHQYSRIFGRKLKGKDYDFIFAPRASTEIALLKTSIPIIYYSDTTFNAMYNYYSWFSNFSKLSVFEGNKTESKAIGNSAIAVFSSEWARNSAVDYYKTPHNKVHIVPFGPNVDYLPSVSEINYNKGSDVIKLLFIGVEWKRKGGQIAVDTLRELHKMGYNATLTVVGTIPPDKVDTEEITIIPFLNKNIKEESLQFSQILNSHHFLLLPTREECFGVVFCEASAYGLPSLTTDTGGIPTAVVNGENGFRFSLADNGKAYADKIVEYFSDYERKYIPLAKLSRRRYEEVLNWKSFGVAIKKIFEDYLHHSNKES